MINFDFAATKKEYSIKEKQTAKDFFIETLGDMRQEFDDSNTFVSINMDAEPTEGRYSFDPKSPDLITKYVERMKRPPM